MGERQRFHDMIIFLKWIHRLPVHRSFPFLSRMIQVLPSCLIGEDLKCIVLLRYFPARALMKEEPSIGLVCHPHAYSLLVAGKLLLYYIWKRERWAYQFDEQVTKGERFRVKRGGNHKCARNVDGTVTGLCKFCN
jgi:hypothetical protein